MKILFFIENLRSGGKERRIVELIKRLVRIEGMQIDLVLTKREIHYEEIRELPIRIHYTERKYFKKDPRLFFLFFVLVKKIRPDIIHAWGNMVAFYAIPAKVVFRIPMVNSQITDAPEHLSIGFFDHRFTFPFSDRVVANSQAGLKAYNAPLGKSQVIYNGFDPKRIENLASEESVRIKFRISTPYVIGMVASFSKWKDHETYLNAASIVLSRRNDVTFLCIGDGNDAKYREMIDKDQRSRVMFLGKQSDVESIMNMCTVGVLCTFGEGISNAILEFSALGKPVLATDLGGTSEILADGKSGYLLKPKDPSGLAEKIEALLDNEPLRTNFGESAKLIVEQKFNIVQMVDGFFELYQTIVEAKPQ